MPTEIEEKKVLASSLLDYVKTYCESLGPARLRPLPLRIIGSVFGKRVRRITGLDVASYIKTCPEIYLHTDYTTAKRSVAPKAMIEAMDELDQAFFFEDLHWQELIYEKLEEARKEEERQAARDLSSPELRSGQINEAGTES